MAEEACLLLLLVEAAGELQAAEAGQRQEQLQHVGVEGAEGCWPLQLPSWNKYKNGNAVTKKRKNERIRCYSEKSSASPFITEATGALMRPKFLLLGRKLKCILRS